MVNIVILLFSFSLVSSSCQTARDKQPISKGYATFMPLFPYNKVNG